MSELDTLPKVAVILGAGANIGIEGLGGGNTNPVWTPPLTRDLFGPKIRLREWEDVIAPYQGARNIAYRLDYSLRRDPEVNLEAQLNEFANHPDQTTRVNFRFVAPFLRDLLRNVSRGYLAAQDPRTLHELVTTLLTEVPKHHVAFITLNYDDFLEQALQIYNPAEYQFTGMGHYVQANRQAKVFKLHGSINWVAPFGNESSDWDAEVRTMEEPLAVLVERMDVAKRDYASVRDQPFQGTWLYPMLAVPMPGKAPLCPPIHTERMRDFLANCRKVLVIGNSGLDDDLLGLIDSALPNVDALHYVADITESARMVAARFERRVKGFRWASSKRANSKIEYCTYPDEDVEPGREGIAGYVASPEFSRFARFLPSA